MIDSREINGGTLASFGALNVLAIGLHSAHAEFQTGGKKFNFVFGRDLTADQRARDHGTKTFDRKGTIDRQTKIAPRILPCHLARLLDQSSFQLR